MTTTLTVRDESASGQTLRSTTIEFPAEHITVEELIRSYVFQNVKDANATLADEPASAPLVAPTVDEVILNGSNSTKANPVSWQAEFEKTKQAFQQHQILVFVNEQQTNSLDAVLTIGPSTEVRFLRLTMLMGG